MDAVNGAFIGEVVNGGALMEGRGVERVMTKQRGGRGSRDSRGRSSSLFTDFCDDDSSASLASESDGRKRGVINNFRLSEKNGPTEDGEEYKDDGG